MVLKFMHKYTLLPLNQIMPSYITFLSRATYNIPHPTSVHSPQSPIQPRNLLVSSHLPGNSFSSSFIVYSDNTTSLPGLVLYYYSPGSSKRLYKIIMIETFYILGCENEEQTWNQTTSNS